MRNIISYQLIWTTKLMNEPLTSKFIKYHSTMWLRIWTSKLISCALLVLTKHKIKPSLFCMCILCPYSICRYVVLVYRKPKISGLCTFNIIISTLINYPSYMYLFLYFLILYNINSKDPLLISSEQILTIHSCILFSNYCLSFIAIL